MFIDLQHCSQLQVFNKLNFINDMEDLYIDVYDQIGFNCMWHIFCPMLV